MLTLVRRIKKLHWLGMRSGITNKRISGNQLLPTLGGQIFLTRALLQLQMGNRLHNVIDEDCAAIKKGKM